MPKKGRVAEPGLAATAPGIGRALIPPAVACGHRLALLVAHLGLNAEERPRRRAGLGGHRAGNRRDHDRPGLGLPPGIDDGAAVMADLLAVPHPGFGGDRLADRAP